MTLHELRRAISTLRSSTAPLVDRRAALELLEAAESGWSHDNYAISELIGRYNALNERRLAALDALDGEPR